MPSLSDGHRPIRFHFRGRDVTVDGVSTTRTVLDWLREDMHATGTKEGCNEGDCGACTVVIGELAPDRTAAGTDRTGADGLRLTTANACIRFLPTLHGKALFTVEDLRRIAGGALHPTQQAMVDCHGSQCGFCTPGFIMSLWQTYECHQAAGSRPDRQQLADALSGNLCRCTGYRPILEAGQRMFDARPVRLETAPVVAALTAMRAVQEADATPWTYAAPNPAQPAGRIDRFHAPRTIDALAALRQRLPAARMLAGATDIGLWVNKQMRDVGDLIYTGDVAGLGRIRIEHDHLVIGAAASLEDGWRALAGHYPTLTEVWFRFASPPVRHAGTLGGNVVNGSPIGDAPPVLLALDATLTLRAGDRQRTLPIGEFYIDYMKNRLAEGEFLESITVPLPTGTPGAMPAGTAPAGARPAPATEHLRAYKISKRFDSDITALLGAFRLQVDAAGVVTQARFAFGGMAAIARRSAAVESAVLGRVWSLDTVRTAQAALAGDFTPLSDMRASAGYRMEVAKNLLERFWLETRADDPLAADAVRVFASMPHAV